MRLVLAALLATVAFGDAHLFGVCHIVAEADATDNDTNNANEATCCGDDGALCPDTKTFTPRCGANHTGLWPSPDAPDAAGPDALCCEPDTANATCWTAQGHCDLMAAGDDVEEPEGCTAEATKMDGSFMTLTTDLAACEAAHDSDDDDRRRRLHGHVGCYQDAFEKGLAQCHAFHDVLDTNVELQKSTLITMIGATAAGQWDASGRCDGMVDWMNKQGWLAMMAPGLDADDIAALHSHFADSEEGSGADGSATSSAAAFSAAVAFVAFAL